MLYVLCIRYRLECAAAKDGEERIPAGEIFYEKNQDIVGTAVILYTKLYLRLIIRFLY